MHRAALLFMLAFPLAAQQPHTLPYAPGKSITLSLPADFSIAIARADLRRPRFFAQSPDGRIFVTTMYNLADNTNGTITILDGYDAQTHTFARAIPFLQHLRNPNNLAFYTDPAGQTWVYVPLTDKLVRYKYTPGANAPAGRPETLLRFPDYGLNYKYGGWHLTRTVAIATLHGRTRVYLTAGSSCNYCQELESERASLIAMDPDGSDPQILAHGLRNAVDLRFISGLDGGALFATNMGDDHLGDKLPEDTFFELDSNGSPGPLALSPGPSHYGWPTCYFAHGKPVLDTTPLPTNPGPNDKEVADRPTTNLSSRPKRDAVDRPASQRGTDSAYGTQSAGAAAGTNLAAQAHTDAQLPDLGPVPPPLRSCKDVPSAYTTFAAHSSPLGLAYFNAENERLHDHFLVALHGSGHPRIGTGYRLAAFTAADRSPQDFLTGFLTHDAAGRSTIHGRPCGILRIAPDTFLLTDDYLGLVYVIYPH